MSNSQTIRFKSKKNEVFLRNGIVEKHRTVPEAATFEANMLKSLHAKGLAVPRVLSVENNLIKMEYIEGLTLPDLIDELESKEHSIKEIEKIAKALVVWLSEFFIAIDTRRTGKGRGDINGRNFIFDGEKIWGIDFEEESLDWHFSPKQEAESDVIEKDIAQLMAFVLNYDPSNTPLKIKLSNSILSYAETILSVNAETVLRQCQQETEALLLRRQK
jgi:RIO-like serine/threonine protein kinase